MSSNSVDTCAVVESFEREALSLTLVVAGACSLSVNAGDDSAVEESDEDNSDTVRERVLRSFSAEAAAAVDHFALL